MTTVRQTLDEQAQTAPFTPSSDVPRSNVWDAVLYVRGLLTLSQYAADAAQSLAQTAIGLARRALMSARGSRFVADEARTRAMIAHSAARDTRRASDAQTALAAQVFN